MRHLPAVLLGIILPSTTTAQEHSFPVPQHTYMGQPHFENLFDSAEFMRFRAGLQWNRTAAAVDTTSITYKQVWRENQHGGLWKVSRGDGSTLARSAGAERIGPMHEESHFRTASGKRGIMIAWETPCGLICRTASYYVEEQSVQ